MMEELMRRMKNLERDFEGSKGFVNGDRVGKRDEIDEESEEEKKGNQQGWTRRI